jgi:hypothetical protein
MGSWGAVLALTGQTFRMFRMLLARHSFWPFTFGGTLQRLLLAASKHCTLAMVVVLLLVVFCFTSGALLHQQLMTMHLYVSQLESPALCIPEAVHICSSIISARRAEQ